MEYTATAEVSGTHLQGYITTTRAKLTRAFGEPWVQDFTEKVTLEWGVLFADGTLATVYDWKRYDQRDLEQEEEYAYHIGGLSPRAVQLITETMEQVSA